MVGDANLRGTVEGSRPHNHGTILVDAPPTKGEPGATYQLRIVRVVGVTKKANTDLGTDSRIGVSA